MAGAILVENEKQVCLDMAVSLKWSLTTFLSLLHEWSVIQFHYLKTSWTSLGKGRSEKLVSVTVITGPSI